MSEQKHEAAARTGAGADPAEAQVPFHEYDGIEEQDNSVPGWLAAIFYVTILFSLGYIPYYLLGYALDFDTPTVELAKEMKLIQAQRDAELKARPRPAVTEESLAKLAADSGAVEAGRKQFATTCGACHGDRGQGLIGPNLTDNAWLHGGHLMDIRVTIDQGIVAKGMPPWGSALGPDKVDALVAYIHSIQGSNPAGAKAPQGVPVASN